MNVYRYPIKRLASYSGALRPQEIKLPHSSKVVDAVYSAQREEFSIYAEVDQEMIQRDKFNVRRFTILSTGETVPAKSRHIRSIVMPDGFHVFHVYEVA